MARITPPTEGVPNGLEDFEPYRVLLKTVLLGKGAEQYGGEPRLEFTWSLQDDSGDTLRDWVSLRLGRQQSGQVSKLRALLNAVAQRPEATDVAWFDDQTFEWSYDGNRPVARLSEGLEVVVRGKVEEKSDGSGPRFRITTYQSPKAASRSTRPAAVAVPAAPDPADDDIPF